MDHIEIKGCSTREALHQDALAAAHIRQSMSRKGDPYDNAAAEDFFSCLKCELIHLNRYATRAQAQADIFRYIEGFYNTLRPHSAPGWLLGSLQSSLSTALPAAYSGNKIRQSGGAVVKRCVSLEPAAEAVCDQSAVPPLIFQLPPEQGRSVLEKAQDAPVYLYPVDRSVREIDTGRWGKIPVFLVTPQGAVPRQVIFYIHGGGWVLGSFHTHEKLVRELAARTDSLVIFPEYSRAPEAKYPAAIEQCYFILSHLWELIGDSWPELDRDSLTVAGDSAGGNMAAAMALMAKARNGPKMQKLLLYYPVTNACFDTPSYRQFAVNYYLYRAGMRWFWDQYTACKTDRNQITASPLRAGIDCLRGLPDTMIINGQADVLCSEGKAFGERLRCAGVPVTALCLPGIIISEFKIRK